MCLGGWCSSYISSSISSKQASRCADRRRCTGSPAKVGRQLQVGGDEVDDARPHIQSCGRSRSSHELVEGGFALGRPNEGRLGGPPLHSVHIRNDEGKSIRLGGAPNSTFGQPRLSTGTRIPPSRGLGCRAVDTDGSTGPFSFGELFSNARSRIFPTS